MHERYKILPVDRDDLDRIAQIESAAFGPDAFGMETLEYCLDSAMYFWKLLDTTVNLLRGFIIVNNYQPEEIHYPFTPGVADPENLISHIMNIAIEASFRNQGIGSFFLKEIAGMLHDLDFRYILLEVQHTNAAARRFYLKNGFTVRQHVPGYYRSGDAADVLWKELQ
jgi:ribosomal protein S18 acetylase RimI-like enzyme